MHGAKRDLAGYLGTLVAFFTLDAAWLSLVAIEMFKRQIGAIMRDSPDFAAALVFYLVYAGGLYVLAVRSARSIPSASATGAVVGLTAYATFDLTNLAVIKGWTMTLALADMGWGTVASAVAGAAGYVVASRGAAGRGPLGGARQRE